MDQHRWSAVDAYLAEHDVSALQGKFLHLVARMIGARRVLEKGWDGFALALVE